MLEVRLLGQFDVRREGIPVLLPSRAAQALLAYLALTAGTAHRREKLAGLLWPDSTEEHARQNLRQELWRLRQAIEVKSPRKRAAPYLLADEISLGFNAQSEYWLDVTLVQQPVPDPVSADALIQMLSLYKGELLPGMYQDWVLLEREHVRAVFEQKMSRLLEQLVEGKRWPEVLDWGERWIVLGHTPEPSYRALMVAYAALGNMAQVAAVYDRCFKALRDELGVEPSAQSQMLFEQLCKPAGKVTPLRPRSDAPSALASSMLPRPHVLPTPLTSFIGRERELEQIKALLSKTRLLTLVGSGGVGKTRLAIQLAHQISNQYRDGVWWVDLVALTDPALVPQAVANVLDIPEAPNVRMIETLVHVLRSVQILLVLDNCEHLVAACAQLAEYLLSTCPSIQILTASREVLGLTGETTWQVPSLSLPETDHPLGVASLDRYESIRLFVERAVAVRPDFAITERNASLVVQICRRLDGLALAIELAAVRVRMLSIQQIAARLDDRFNILTRGNRTALPHQQTLRAAIDWSFDLLSDLERILFRRLSVFVGGWTLEAAEGVCSGEAVEQGQVLELLTHLVDKSVVIVQEQDPVPRYRMLESIREYARDKLSKAGEIEQLRRRHRDWFTALAKQAERGLKSADQLEWLDRLEAERENLRSAWDCALETDTRSALMLASGLMDFWFVRGNPSEGRAWLTKLVERTAGWGQTVPRAHVLGLAGLAAYLQDDIPSARSLLEQALVITRRAGDQKELAFVLLWMGRMAWLERDIQAAQTFNEESWATYQRLEDPWGIAMSSYFLGALAAQDTYVEAEARFKTSLAIFQQLGDKFRTGFVLNGLGELARLSGDYAQAGQYYEESIKILRALRGRVALESPSFNMAWVSLHRGDFGKARALFEEILNLYREHGNPYGMRDCLPGFAGILAMTGKPAQAARLFGAVESLNQGIGIGRPLEPADQGDFDYYVAVVREQLDGDTFTKAWNEGRAMSMEQAIAYALGDEQ